MPIELHNKSENGTNNDTYSSKSIPASEKLTENGESSATSKSIWSLPPGMVGAKRDEIAVREISRPQISSFYQKKSQDARDTFGVKTSPSFPIKRCDGLKSGTDMSNDINANNINCGHRLSESFNKAHLEDFLQRTETNIKKFKIPEQKYGKRSYINLSSTSTSRPISTGLNLLPVSLNPITTQDASTVKKIHNEINFAAQSCESPSEMDTTVSKPSDEKKNTSVRAITRPGIFRSKDSLPLKKLTLSAYRKPEIAVRLTDAPPSRDLFLDYDLTSFPCVLGHGASSTVRLATHRTTGSKVAVKCIAKHDILRSYRHKGRRKERLEEYDIMALLKNSHDNIINLLDVYETETEVQLVMEYCPGGELFDAIQKKSKRSGNRVTKDEGSNQFKTHQFQAPQELLESDNVFIGSSRKRNRSETHFSPSVSSIALKKSKNSSSGMSSSSSVNSSGYTEAQAANIACQLLSALAHLHGRGIVHRDVKPENILLMSQDDNDDQLHVKLSDFGLARVLHSQNCFGTNDQDSCSASNLTGHVSPFTPPSVRRSRAYSRVGSDYYAAPEVGTGKGYDTAVDVYSLGVTLYILLSGFPPVSRPRCGSLVLDNDSSSSSESSEEEDGVALSKSNMSPVDFPQQHWRHVSTSAKNLVRRMLHPNPLHRITAAEALRHEWTVSHTSKKSCNKSCGTIKEKKNVEIEATLNENLCKRKKCNTFLSPIASPFSIDVTYLTNSFFDVKSSTPSAGTTFSPGSKSGESSFKKQCYQEACRKHSIGSVAHKKYNILPRMPPPQNVMSVSMADLYSRVTNVATAAAVGISDEEDLSSNSLVHRNVTDLVVEEDENDTSRNSPEQATHVFSSNMRPLSV